MLLLFTIPAFAGIRAITDTGEEVILNSDGTWEYLKSPAVGNDIPVNSVSYTKPGSAQFLLKSTMNNSGFWVDTQKWQFSKASQNEAAEYEFKLKGKDLYGITITEEMSIPLDSLVKIALDNLLKEAPDARVILKEYRNVNGLNLIHMQMRATVSGIDVVYYGYYYSDDSGSTQLLTYSSSKLIQRYQAQAYELLNGLVAQ